MDSQRPRDGEYLESLGHYDPRTKQLAIDLDRARYWQSVGAQPTGTADKLIKRVARERAVAVSDGPTELIPPAEAIEVAVEVVAAEVVDNTEPAGPPPVTTEAPEADTAAAEDGAVIEREPADDTAT